MKNAFNDSLGINIKQYICCMNMILVTGALGQIGTELVLALQEKYGKDKIIASDLKEPNNYNGKFVKCDIRDMETYEQINKENNILIKDKFSFIGQEYIKKINSLNVKEKIITDKWPLNFRHIGFILSAMPNAKIVHLRRDPRAICFSIYRHYFSDRANGWAYDLDDITKF